MSNEGIRQKISDYLQSHNILTLATVTAEGKPQAHTVTYVNEGTTVYFGTLKDTRKARNIMNNSSVAFTVDEDYPDWNVIQGIQMSGQASLLTDQGELERIGKMYMEKFPQAADLPKSENMIMIKITATNGYFLDNTKGFTHRDEVMF
jgi:general stress protein 26